MLILCSGIFVGIFMIKWLPRCFDHSDNDLKTMGFIEYWKHSRKTHYCHWLLLFNQMCILSYQGLRYLNPWPHRWSLL